MTLRGLTWGASLKDRLLYRVTKGKKCWLWRGGIRDNGYGTFAVLRNGRWTQTTAHRVAYEVFVGPIPKGFEIDHLCNNRACVNPAHLEAITLAENRARRNARKMHCSQGHAFDEENTYWYVGRDGYRCRQCNICRHYYSLSVNRGKARKGNRKASRTSR